MTIQDIERKIGDIAYNKKFDVTTVFTDFLDYIIGYFNPTLTPTPINGWGERYNQDDNKKFYLLMADYFVLMDEQLKHKEWYDAFGDLFMQIHVKGNNKAQFFTPDALCNLMAKTSIDESKEPTPTVHTTFGKRTIINDCACGSSRNLLAAHAVFTKNKWEKPYLVAEDLDLTCCKMSAINMAMHGCFGEVIHHNTLEEPNKADMGYVINETMYPIPTNLPSIRSVSDSFRFVGINIWKGEKSSSEATKRGKNSNSQSATQLTLF